MDITVINETMSYPPFSMSDEDEEHFECIRLIGRALGYDIYAHATRKHSAYAKGPAPYQVWARDANDTTRYLGMLSALTELRSSEIRALITAKFARPAEPLSKEDIIRIAGQVGYRARFRRYTRRNNEVCNYVTCIIDSGDAELTIGGLDEIAKLSEDELRQRIVAKFATATTK